MPQPCEQAETIERINNRLHLGDLTLQDIKTQLTILNESVSAILTQTTKTNGRVTKMEKIQRTVISMFCGMLIFAAAQSLGLTKVLLTILK